MTCREANDYIDQAGQETSCRIPDEVLDHLQACSACRPLWQFLSTKDRPWSVAAPVADAIRGDLMASLAPVNPMPEEGRLFAGFALTFVLTTGLLAAYVGVHGTVAMGGLRFGAILATAGLLGLLLSWILSREIVPGTRKHWSVPLAAGAILAGLLAVIALALSWRTGAGFLAHSWHCFRAGVVLSLPAAVLALVLLRRGRILSRGGAGALAGLWAGLAGFVTLHFGCAMSTAPHALVGHWAVPLVGVVLGYGVGHWMPATWQSGRRSSSRPLGPLEG